MSSSLDNNVVNDNITIEAILENEPFDNNYFIIPPSLMNLHPYVFLGKLETHFVSSSKQNCISEGVGFLIGNDIILTSAHNIYNGVNEPTLIEFTPLINGAIKLMSPIKVVHYELMHEFRERKLKGITDDILMFDFAVCFLEKKLGSEIIEMFNINTKIETKFKFFNFGNKQLFYYFMQLKNEMLNLHHKFCDGNMCEKISMISYINYKTEYLQTEHFRFKTSILRALSNKQNITHETTHHNEYHIFMPEFKERKRKASNIKSLNNNTMYLENNSTLLSECRGTLCNTLGVYKNKKGKSSNNLQEDIRVSEISLSDRPTRDTMSYNRMSIYNKNLTHSIKDNKLYEMDYLITTYVGQSGSPIFLRKKNNDYILIGIHSRSSGTFPLISNSSHDNQSNYILNSGMSLYNIGLALTPTIQTIIYKMISKNSTFNVNELQLSREMYFNNTTSNYFVVAIFNNNNCIFNGLFHKTVNCMNIINIISNDYLGISPEYIKLLHKSSQSCKCYDYHTVIDLSQLQCTDVTIRLEVEVVEDKFVKDVAKNVISKIKETGKKVIKGNKKLLVNLIVLTIQSELNVIHKQNLFLYAKLYHLIQNKVAMEFINELK